ncbi:MAG: cytochrome c, class [Myxococcaceae bacterium]|nr:cytochrome c, class [Myxococcaceae bacterium]
MKTVLKVFGGLVFLLVVAAGGAFAWGKSTAAGKLAAKVETHRVDFPIPFPLTEAELAELKAQQPEAAEAELKKVALERAIARGKHLVDARYACSECHGKNFGGGVMVDAPPIGKILGVNLTSGKGGQIANYQPADWDRIVRHGVLPDGRPAAMPSLDFVAMTDRELSDIVAYLLSVPPVDAEIARPTLGPVGTMLIATGKLPLSANVITEHQAPHRIEPPAAAETTEFGKHLVGVCTGCHGADLSGGPVPGGDPSWPPALNLTPHADGLAGWSYEDFVRALKEGKRKNGAELRVPMSAMKAYAANITQTELKAMWAYLQTAPARPSPK